MSSGKGEVTALGTNTTPLRSTVRSVRFGRLARAPLRLKRSGPKVEVEGEKLGTGLYSRPVGPRRLP